MKLKINGKEIKGNQFAYDNCHKIYVIENEEDKEKALSYGYTIYDIEDIESAYNESCDLRFIRNWNLDISYVRQCESAKFEWEI